MKKLISLFTTLCIVLGVLGTFTVFAEETAADLEISTLAELEAFRDDVNNGNTYEGKTVKLTADIDMSDKYGEGKENWTPIGTFAGTFDGNNHAISGLYINTDGDFAALFDTVNGTIKDLIVKGSVSTTSFNGQVAGIAVSNCGSVINCIFDGTVECPHCSAAGIASLNNGIIENCKVSGKIIGEHNVGGISGNSGGEFISCINEAEIIGWAPVGGIASSGYECKFINCINKGSITARPYINTNTDDESGEEITNIVASMSIGGIVGETSTMSTIENCYNTGAISGNSEVGGIIGVSDGSSEEPLQVKNCYNIGNITSTMEKNDGEHNIGAIIGNREYEDWDSDTKVITSEAVNCYYLVGTADKGCGGNADDTTTALTTEQFANRDNFTGWKFFYLYGKSAVWEMNKTLGRPILRSNREAYIPYEIDTAYDLAAFRDAVNNGHSYEGETVILNNDIDLSEVCGANINGKEISWEPIGNYAWDNSKPFSGTFNGKGHTINNLYINTDKLCSALFEYVSGTIKNLNVNGSVLTTNQDGNIAGIVAMLEVDGAIIDCSFDGISESMYYVAAGIVSDNSGLISGCKFNGQVIGEHLTAGIASRNWGTITNCINEGEITATIGGGGIMAGGSGTVTNCVNKGTVKGVSYQLEFMDEPEISYGVGGIAGIMSISGGVIENCYNTGAVSGNSEVGGILGKADYWGDEVISPVTVKNCYNIGNVTSTLENAEEHYIGGVIGNVECEYIDNSSYQEVKIIGGEAISCYYLTGTADKGIALVGEGGEDITTALTAEQFADKTNFTNWDFDTVWKMDATLGRPVLRSNTEDTDEVIEISTLAELEAFRDDVNSGNTYEGKTVKLTADIDMSEKYGEGKLSWEPISDNNLIPFIGTFDGCFCKITGLYSTNNGLFMFNNGTIQNVSVSGEIICRSDGGGIVGNNFGKIICCSFSGSITGGGHLGGIAGANMVIDEGTGIFDCYNTATVTSNEGVVGGIAGLTGRIERCYNIGSVSANDMFASIGAGDGPIIDCYYLEGTSDKGWYIEYEGVTDTTTALTTEQFADKSNFTNWDFDTVWEMDATLGRPVLRSGTEEPPIETHTHTLVHHAAVAATCTETGTGEYWKCEGTDACNKMFSDENGTTEIAEIPTITATGHTEVTDTAVEPTCETDGKTAGSHCSVCNTVITEQTIIPKLNHSWGAWSITTEPTFDVTGKAERICENDNTHKEIVDLPILTDTKVWTEDLKIEPTETEKGSVTYTSQYGNVTIIIPALNPEYDYIIKYENGKAIVIVPQDGTYTVIFAAYDNGRLLSVNAQDIQLVKGENSPISPQNFNANGKVKVMLWDSLMGMKPLCAADGN